ncbi:MAG: hypothetical protein ACI4LD_07900 [Lentihominibacter sp.]
MHNYFNGWYMKCQSDSQVMAFIPAVHQSGDRRTASIQIITSEKSWTVPYSADNFRRDGMNIIIGENSFSKSGISLSIHTQELDIDAKLDFGPLHKKTSCIPSLFFHLNFIMCHHII